MNMQKVLKTTIAVLLLTLQTACSKPKPKDYTLFNQVKPKSILIVPVVNESVDVSSPDYFLSTIPIPVSEQGYYVFPVNMVKRVLEDNGLSDANMVHGAPPQKLSALFDADAILYITINNWDAEYAVLTTTVKVSLTYEIKDGKSGETLWWDQESVVYKPQNQDTGHPIGNLVAMAVTAAIAKAKPNYIPLAKQANQKAFTYPGPGIPPGHYAKNKKGS